MNKNKKMLSKSPYFKGGFRIFILDCLVFVGPISVIVVISVRHVWVPPLMGESLSHPMASKYFWEEKKITKKKINYSLSVDLCQLIKHSHCCQCMRN